MGHFSMAKSTLAQKNFKGGRSGESASFGLSETLQKAGFVTGRMKTGTPPRLDGRTIDFKKLEQDSGDDAPGTFSFLSRHKIKDQIPCHVAYTNNEVHSILRDGFSQSPLFDGSIESTGPRYCPSIEDKISRFAERDRHQLFIEPEGRKTCEIYINGFSTSLPEEIQNKALRKIVGFENVKMFRPGYAIEYDFFQPTQLNHTLETKLIKNLYFAGQINGTTGYEEAACQGLMAGINASLKIDKKSEFILKRDEAYIGVLIDDLVTKGTDEPYRMFTSRAEYRILLRQDNADLRLTRIGEKLGTVCQKRINRLKEKEDYINELLRLIKGKNMDPSEINPTLEELGESTISKKLELKKILSRPNIKFKHIEKSLVISEFLKNRSIDIESIEQAEIQIKYSGYLKKEQENVEKFNRLEKINIPEKFDFDKIKSISSEGREKLKKIQPLTIGQASRISGVSPSDISVLMVFIGR